MLAKGDEDTPEDLRGPANSEFQLTDGSKVRVLWGQLARVS